MQSLTALVLFVSHSLFCFFAVCICVYSGIHDSFVVLHLPLFLFCHFHFVHARCNSSDFIGKKHYLNARRGRGRTEYFECIKHLGRQRLCPRLCWGAYGARQILSWWGRGSLPLPKNPVPALSLSSLELRPFGPRICIHNLLLSNGGKVK